MDTALCKLRGALVLMEVAPARDGRGGRCPQCGGVSFRRGEGCATNWTECLHCDFAVLTDHLKLPAPPGEEQE